MLHLQDHLVRLASLRLQKRQYPGPLLWLVAMREQLPAWKVVVASAASSLLESETRLQTIALVDLSLLVARLRSERLENLAHQLRGRLGWPYLGSCLALPPCGRLVRRSSSRSQRKLASRHDAHRSRLVGRS